MVANINTTVMQLAASSSNGITISQALGVAGNLTINGSLASAGVATMDVARRIGITSAGNDSGITFTITGTDRGGRPLSETVTGANAGTVQTKGDFKTVTKIAASGAVATTVTAGTTGVASSAPIAIDYFANPASYGAAVVVSGTVNYTVEQSYDDVLPSYDVNTTPPTYFGATGFTSQSGNVAGNITGPCTLARLTINSGTGSASLKLIQPFLAGGV